MNQLNLKVKLVFCYKIANKDTTGKKDFILKSQEGRGHWAVYYTSPQSFIITFLIRWLKNFGDFYLILIGWFIKLSVQTFQPLILIYRSDNLFIIKGMYINLPAIVPV